jgi:adenine-specific DNA methylase
MIPKACKRLAEVDFPIAAVSRHSASATRDGNPSTIHLWWARRPLAACRAMLLALLLPDPVDEHCPEEFKTAARNILPRVQGAPGNSAIGLRTELLRFIGDFAKTENCLKQLYLDAARGLLRAANGEEPPLVVDSFAGGGSIPMEALRLGCDAFASDLNPVASLMLKALLEDVPRHGRQLEEELQRVGVAIREVAETELRGFYPIDKDGRVPVAYLWARTIICDNCGAEIPLIRSFWLRKKSHRKVALRHKVVRMGAKHASVEFEVFEPKDESEVNTATVMRAKATCLCCNLVTSAERVRIQLVSQNGGASAVFDSSGQRVGGARLLAVVVKENGTSGRAYRVANDADYDAARRASIRLLELGGVDDGESSIPTEELSYDEIRRISVPLYGATKWHHLFTRRQCLAIVAYQRASRDIEMSAGCRRLVALAQDRLVMLLSAHCRWKASGETLIDMFGRHAIGIVWDFAEGTPGEGESNIFGNWIGQYCRFIRQSESVHRVGQVSTADACNHPLSDGACDLWFTDPPYYDSIPYAHLSDCFYVWLRRAGLRELMPNDFSGPVTPKAGECVVDRPHSLSKSKKDAAFFEMSIGLAAKEGRRITSDSGAGCIVFAHKTTEGWEALLSGIVNSGWRVTASWPIATELASRLNARDTASLATSVHLVCRPRSEDAQIGDWSDVVSELPQRVGDWIERLQNEGVKGADLVFACIGPAMEIYSRYRRVEDAEGRDIPLGGDATAMEPYKRGFLSYVWETVGRLALEEVLGTPEAKARNGAAGALEEDSRLTALFLWTLQATQGEVETADGAGDDERGGDDEDEDSPKLKKAKSGYVLIYDVARRFAQPLGIHLERWEGRIIETDKGIVRLLPVVERRAQLFGQADINAVAERIEQDVRANRNYTFAFMPELAAEPEIRTTPRGRSTRNRAIAAEAPAPEQFTTLDRLHAGMWLQRNGRTNALRALLKDEMQRGPDFLRLANALSRLYPKNSDEKRLLDAMLLAIPKN